MPASIELRDVTVESPNGSRILTEVSLSISSGEAVSLIGRSGAGKTTTLRLMNGLAAPSRGQVLVDGRSLTASDLIALRRRTGYVIQHSGLFPHWTVFDNIAAVPRLLGWAEGRTRSAAEALLHRLNLPPEQFATRFPRSLSGGEQQRVGIARALIAKPSILLCDEPFGALDPIVRHELQDAFLELRGDVTVVFVTHDLTEALRIADRVVLFEGGSIVADTAASSFLDLDLPLARAFVVAASLRPPDWPGSSS